MILLGKIKNELIGNIFKNNKGLKFRVNDYLYTKGSELYFEIEFIDTHNKKICSHRAIREGSIKDEYAPNKYGVGYIGRASSNEYNKKAYKKWDSMLSRCYNKNNIEYNNYGGNGVTVCDRWLCFEYFLEDLIKIDGWNEEDFINGKLQLDKDKKQPNKKYKIYSLETCCLINKESFVL